MSYRLSLSRVIVSLESSLRLELLSTVPSRAARSGVGLLDESELEARFGVFRSGSPSEDEDESLRLQRIHYKNSNTSTYQPCGAAPRSLPSTSISTHALPHRHGESEDSKRIIALLRLK